MGEEKRLRTIHYRYLSSYLSENPSKQLAHGTPVLEAYLLTKILLRLAPQGVKTRRKAERP